MRAKRIFAEIPNTIEGQLEMVLEATSGDFERTVQYLKTPEFADARGFAGKLSDEQLVREMHAVIRSNG